MSKLRALILFAFVPLLATSLAHATVIVDETMEWNPAQIPPFNCTDPPATVTQATALINGMQFIVNNPTGRAVWDHFVVEGTVNGQVRQVGGKVEIPPYTSLTVQIEYLTIIGHPVIKVCGNSPVAIVEGPDPIVKLQHLEP